MSSARPFRRKALTRAFESAEVRALLARLSLTLGVFGLARWTEYRFAGELAGVTAALDVFAAIGCVVFLVLTSITIASFVDSALQETRT